jgi:uncharacterized protein YneR
LDGRESPVDATGLFGRAREQILVGVHTELFVKKGGDPDRLVFGFSIGLMIVCPIEEDAIASFREDLNGHD